MRFDILSLFPELFSSFLRGGVLGRALEKELVDIRLTNIRDFARGSHKVTDDRPYGGGNGMIMKPGPIYRALKSIEKIDGQYLVVLLTPQGQRFEQARAWKLSRLDQLVLVCGRYEGVDERIRSKYIDEELSVGDYILSGGELGAMVVMDAVIRLIPGVLGGERSTEEDSFEEGLLEYPHYTRPRIFNGEEVPPVLLSGDHEKIRIWRRTESLKRTLSRRPDLLNRTLLNKEDKDILDKLQEK